MTQHIHRGILIVAAGRVGAANAAFAAMGWGPGNFSIRLSAAPSGGPVTNYALSTVMTEETRAMLVSAIDSGILPSADWAAAGITATDAKNAFGNMTYAFTDNGADPLDQFNAVLRGRTLTRVQDQAI